MSEVISLDLRNAGVSKLSIERAQKILTQIRDKDIEGADLLGWLDLPLQSKEVIDRVKATALHLRNSCSHVVCIGIGGSYIGARAIIEALSENPFATKEKGPSILYAGHNLDQTYLYHLLNLLEGKNFGIIYISKSGTTTEPAIAFRFLKQLLEKNIGKERAAKVTIAITDAQKGALSQIAQEEGYTTLHIPQDVGGRFSALSPVGLLPVAVAGYDIDALLQGARYMKKQSGIEVDASDNMAVHYACLRYALYEKGKKVELMVAQTSRLHSFLEWWKQLFGESEGKKNKGILPHSALFTTDLHSLGQWIQEGDPILFETILSVQKSLHPLSIPMDREDRDQLNYLSGKSLSWINQKATEGTVMAHVHREVPIIGINLETINEYTLGTLIYFFQIAVTISGYLLEVNPFDQPGVEEYKNNMFTLLGKPGC
ncbi:glucose-6-phosphate isomerase [Porphyromonas circumdentaria]|uniref:Glucose-6-phosphate isomerase n=1 Tax=Porphyromonas circumdentaria TaxID=29524 RepID=A0A1T4PFU6_9PORP|nr:glucose-6-phosphate isomerase [Porphyromonas circumdentaria]MBB6275721.1 glucose-6-phosphate isomerase [Porphyromonas circumdentaria]SJZ90435.1 glucose-6-phosphate isomerase [Porphyromonas circumdentaria]